MRKLLALALAGGGAVGSSLLSPQPAHADATGKRGRVPYPRAKSDSLKQWKSWIRWGPWIFEDLMRSFTTHDLNKQVGEVTDAATKSPVVITRHRKPRFVMMSYEHYQRIKETSDPRRAYGAGETPPDIAVLFGDELDRIAEGEGYEDER